MEIKIGDKLRHKLKGTIWTIDDKIAEWGDSFCISTEGEIFRFRVSVDEILRGEMWEHLPQSAKREENACHCGVHIVKDHLPWMHSTYCPLFVPAA